ncbi:Leucine rich repeat-containing protein [Xylanibacter ruminicola]|uniref:Leucine rich repeat-containing protein n=2 Tax=Xylanibacter ruminicola TaxID=839 RepID=A0A1H4E791_XYLRU|nr:Leucine rich repeat-containing protein [Xylanibacter ruminicola]
MKKLYLLLLFVSMSFINAFAQQVSYTDEKGATWIFSYNSYWNEQTQTNNYYWGVKSVTDYGDEITVPATITYNEVEYPVEAVGSEVFMDNKSVSKIILPPSIKRIGNYAFKGCSSLKDVGDISNCEYIYGEAFRACISLTQVNLSSCKTLEWGAFNNCQNLVSIGSLAKIENIGSDAFHECKALKEIDLPANVKIEGLAFYNCTSLTKVGSLDKASIGENAFDNCTSLKSVDLSTVTKIGSRAFDNCTSLESVGDLSAITGLDDGVFYNCRSLKEVNLSSCKTIGSAAFGHCESLTSIDLSSCQTFGDGAFSYCSNLKTVNGFEHFAGVAESAFNGCSKLETINLSNCQTFGANAFSGCSSLTTLGTLPLCETIGNGAFSGCTKLGDVIIESTALTSIGSGAFNHTGTLTFMQITPIAISEYAFGEYLLIKVPAESLEAYQTADVWKDFASRIFAIGDTFDFDIEVEANDNTSSLQEVIGKENLRKVVSLKVTGSINSYDIMIIRNQTPNLHYLDLTNANIVECAQEYYTGYRTEDNIIGGNMFRDLLKLLTIKLPKNVTQIGREAFYGCRNLQDITINEGIVSIGYRAFFDCYGIKEFILPNGLITIETDAFQNCFGLEKVAFPNTLVSIGPWAFYNCSKLSSISLPTSLTTIHDYAFHYCNNLKEVKIPSSVTDIYGNAFSRCEQLNKVYTYTIEPTSIDQNTFSTYSTATLYVPKTSYDNYYWDTEWNQFAKLEEFDEPYSYFYINKDYTLDEDERIDGTPDADLNPGGSLTVEGEDNQDIDDLTVISDGDSGQSGSVIADDNINANWLKFEIKVVPNKWYFFGFPFRILLSNIAFDKEDVNYVFRYYDGAARAENGNGGWKNLPANAEALERGIGYIFQCNKAANLILKVEKPDFTAENVEQTLVEHESAQAQDAGWNFIGNPHISYYDINDTEYSAPITIWNGTSYEAIRPIDDDYFFHPFQGFFVQKPDNKDKVKFNKDDRTSYLQSQKKNKVAQTRRMTRGIDQERLLIELTIGDTEARDKTRIVFNEKATTGYETLCDAAKFISTEDVPQIYTLDNEGAKYAINERPAGEVKVGYLVKTAGTYKIAAIRMDKNVTLYDDVTKTEFDFTNGDYTFESEAGTFDNRFTLKIPTGAATGLAEIKNQTGVNVMGNADGIQISNVGDAMVDIYSLAGVQLATGVRDGFVSLPRATYIVKVNNISTKVMVK